MEKISLKEYSVLKRWENGRKFRNSNSYKIRDYFRHYNKIKPRDKKYIIDESKFHKVITRVGLLMANEYIRTGSIQFPYSMGRIMLVKRDVSPIMKDGKLILRAPIDWNKTLKLWYEDPDAEENKVLVRTERGVIFKTIFDKKGSQIRRKSLFKFDIYKSVRNRIGELANNNEMEAFKRF